MSVKVDFILLGAGKSGTTTMADILQSHPEINFCKEKEPNFFSFTDDWKENVDEYHELFDEEDGKIYGEASHSYTALPQGNLNIWEDIYEYNPEMKFIYIVRNPIDRFVSEYMQDYQRGRFDWTIDEALHKSKSINRSRYYTQIIPYIELFGRENVLIFEFEEFINQRKNIVKKVANFLDISFDKFKSYENKHSNVSVNNMKINWKYDRLIKRFSGLIRLIPDNLVLAVKRIFIDRKRVFNEKPQLTIKQQEAIIRLTRQDTINLEKLINKDLSQWLEINSQLLVVDKTQDLV